MNFEPAEKMKNFEAGIFQILDEKKKELQKQGKKIYNFSVGTPDFETPECVMKAVSEACLHPENYHYSLGETDELLDALAARYKNRYNTDIAKKNGKLCISTPTAINAVEAHKPIRLMKVTFVPLLILSANQPPTGRRAPATSGPTNAMDANGTSGNSLPTNKPSAAA